ncbi:MAG: phytanoyl-CoA dioxygenase family protein [Planctomycetota bacterium]|nr:phytanoyl-CoA dioxygenase family protein [Planctomycetota bacterium]
MSTSTLPISLSAAQVEHYRREGYVVVPRIFDAGDIARADAAIAELTDRAAREGKTEQILELEPAPLDGKPVARRIYNPFHAHETFRGIATDSRLLDRVESLIGPDIAVQHSKLNMKPAKVGSVVEWHQDMTYFPHTNDSLCTLLIYLDDADESNGCLQVLPRSHDRYFNHTLPDGSFAGMIMDPISSGRYGTPVPLAAPAGSVIFMHVLTPHSSLPNVSTRGRRTMIFEYRAADAYPIYWGEASLAAERLVVHVRGNISRTARLAGPNPPIPLLNVDASKRSLYEWQKAAKAALAAAK